MKNTSTLSNSAAALLGLLGLTALFGACSGSSSVGTGGATGTPSGGAAGGAGATGTSALAGAAAGGNTGAAGATSSAGGSASAGSSSSTAACGPKCAMPVTCVPSVVASGLTTLTDFSSNLDSGNIFHTGGVTDWSSLFGGTWISPVASDPCATTQATDPLAESFGGGNWHITGTIAPGKWAGGGFWFATSAACPVLDFSAYSGFSFSIAGNAGPSGSITVTVSTASNTAPNTDATSAGFTCFTNAATCSAASCSAASMNVTDITTTPQTVKVMFADLKGGAPMSTPDPKEITGIGINPAVDWSGSGTPYSLDLTIDDLTLIP